MKKLLLAAVKGYQRMISPLFPPTCRYYPSCSNYTVQAIEMHGAFKGSLMAVARIIRCNPFVEGGVDKVPEQFALKRNPKTKDHIYLGNGITIAEDGPEERQESIEAMLDQYEGQLVIREEEQDAVSFLNSWLTVEESSVAQLPDAYLKDIKAALLKEGFYHSKAELEENLSLHFFKISKTAESQSYYRHVHPSPIRSEFQNGKEIFCLLDEEIGVLDSNSPGLQEAFTLKRGITQKDIEHKTVRLFEYLLALNGRYYHQDHA